MDAYFPDDEEETGVADAPVDASGAFALSDVQAPTGGFQFVSVDDEDSAFFWTCANHLIWAIPAGQHVVRRTNAPRSTSLSPFTWRRATLLRPARLDSLSYSGSLSGRSFNQFGVTSVLFLRHARVSATTPCKNSTHLLPCLGLASPLPPVPESALLCASLSPHRPSPSHGFPACCRCTQPPRLYRTKGSHR